MRILSCLGNPFKALYNKISDFIVSRGNPRPVSRSSVTPHLAASRSPNITSNSSLCPSKSVRRSQGHKNFSEPSAPRKFTPRPGGGLCCWGKPYTNKWNQVIPGAENLPNQPPPEVYKHGRDHY